jgi:NadR type nicotinamide-nucleotide adenylyltransferase
MMRVAVIGPESTGKTDLANAIVQAYNGTYVPEFAREYLNGLNRPYQQEDLLQIAKGQVESLEKNDSAEVLIADTDLHIIKIWSEHKYGNCDPWIFQELNKQAFDLYILTYFDIPYEEDPLRENPEDRAYFFEIYLDLLTTSKLPFIVVKGSREARLKMAMNRIDALL